MKDEMVKTIGLLGGMSWESTLPYYRIVNQTIGRELGGLHSAKILLYSVDFHEIEILQHAGAWETAGAILAEAARRLETAGADFLVLCTNTMHKVAPAIQRERSGFRSCASLMPRRMRSGRPGSKPWGSWGPGSRWRSRSTANGWRRRGCG
jgi:hypothetical protein